MIVNKLLFVINANMNFVDGTTRVGNLSANSINRDMFYIISPVVPDTLIKATFKNYKQAERGESVLFKLSDLKVSDLVDKNDKSTPYELIKDWNVWQSFSPNKALAYIASNRAGEISVSFSFTDRIIPRIKGDIPFISDVYDIVDLGTPEYGYYVIKTTLLEYDTDLYAYYNDILIYDGAEFIHKKALVQKTGTEPLKYRVDPNIEDGDYHDIEFDLIDTLISMVGDLGGDLKETNLNVADLDERVTQNEGLIEDLENDKADTTYVNTELNKKANKSTTINGYDLSENRVLESDDIPHNATDVKAELERLDSEKAKKPTNIGDANFDTLYLLTKNGIESGIKVGHVIEPNVVPKRGGSGHLYTPTAIEGTQATPKAQVESLISAHNSSETAHLYIRELIQTLQQEIDRLDGKGKSYGAIDKTQSELLGMTEGDRNTYIGNFLSGKYDGYVLTNGDLIYTKTVVGENEHEWEYNGSTWVDNGAWTTEKASNTEYGNIKGDGTYLSIVSGIVQVLLSDYANRIGDNVNYLDYTVIKNAIDSLSNYYIKSETYNQYEIETRIQDMLYTGVFLIDLGGFIDPVVDALIDLGGF